MKKKPLKSASASAALTEADWDRLLDGTVWQVDLRQLNFVGDVRNFQHAVHHEAKLRYGKARARMVHRRHERHLVQVQAFGCRPEFARWHKTAPRVYYGRPRPLTSTVEAASVAERVVD